MPPPLPPSRIPPIRRYLPYRTAYQIGASVSYLLSPHVTVCLTSPLFAAEHGRFQPRTQFLASCFKACSLATTIPHQFQPPSCFLSLPISVTGRPNTRKHLSPVFFKQSRYSSRLWSFLKHPSSKQRPHTTESRKDRQVSAFSHSADPNCPISINHEYHHQIQQQHTYHQSS